MELHDSTKQPTPVVNLIYLRRLTDRSLFLSGVEFCRVLELFLHGDGAILVEILRVVRSGRDRAAGTALRRTPSPRRHEALQPRLASLWAVPEVVCRGQASPVRLQDPAL